MAELADTASRPSTRVGCSANGRHRHLDGSRRRHVRRRHGRLRRRRASGPRAARDPGDDVPRDRVPRRAARVPRTARRRCRGPRCATPSRPGLVTVGSHTHTHALLDRIPDGRSPTSSTGRSPSSRTSLGVDAGSLRLPEVRRAVRRPRTGPVRARFRSAALAGTRPNRVRPHRSAPAGPLADPGRRRDALVPGARWPAGWGSRTTCAAASTGGATRAPRREATGRGSCTSRPPT